MTKRQIFFWAGIGMMLFSTLSLATVAALENGVTGFLVVVGIAGLVGGAFTLVQLID